MKEKTLSYPIEPGDYKFCIFGAKAIKGGRGGKMCGQHSFSQKAVLILELGTQDSGGEGGKNCGQYLKGNGYNGAGHGMIKYSIELLIVAGGGGGNSENGDYGGDAESKGDGDYGERNN